MRLFSSTRSEALAISLDGVSYPLQLRRSKQARSIIVSADTVKGVVRLTLPSYASEQQALRFAQSKSGWLNERFAEAVPPVPVEDGGQIAFLGEPCIIRWSPDFARTPLLVEDEIRLGGPQEHIESRILRWLKTQARTIFADDLQFYCSRAGTDLPRLAVGDARRRWGSCSGRQSIRLSWRLVMAPPHVRRSVVAHEVAHLTHMDHSRRFYALLDDIFESDRRVADRWLKDHGRGLHMVGAARQLPPAA
ncbi:MAG: M48 family metallopeptidase [Sphingomonadales bacterium]|nr:M48 family metallopeptidase [Sphingomonadales bacterium]PIX64769.1 MAG: metal-dependent hydrolase [Sphingomonadales bacterium CG_4_10_14_3_um_filter_58_15]NCO48199.1 M48 family metallopeptidase [Sphingomonadales bacterium]NCO99772.1 M48 family metallopeptidase [Sphingomonadales bacterium]NCP28176.1 M48 family metallopeptidase [Sphingomonadales bacterium]